MEYLMTYGWAILIVIVVGAVLVYYGVFKPPISKTTSGFGSIAVIDQDYGTNALLRLYVENRAGDAISISTVNVTNNANAVINCLPLNSSTSSMVLPMAGRAWLSCTGQGDIAGAMYTPTVVITYVKAGQSLSSTGTVSGQRS